MLPHQPVRRGADSSENRATGCGSDDRNLFLVSCLTRGVRSTSQPPIFPYLQSLGEAAERAGVRLHAYVLMTNHVHLLVTPAEENGIPELMQGLGTRYVWRVNQVYR